MTRTLGQELLFAMDAFTEKGTSALPAFLALYDEGIEFQDPLVHTHGREAFAAAMRKLLDLSPSLGIACGELAENADGTLFLSWRMTVGLKVGPAVVVHGVTHARTREGRIVWQRDHWDLLSSAAAAFPIVGSVYAWLTNLVAGKPR